MSLYVREFLVKRKVAPLSQSPYSPDLAADYCFYFPIVKTPFKNAVLRASRLSKPP
jgi:hypothetical protein